MGIGTNNPTALLNIVGGDRQDGLRVEGGNASLALVSTREYQIFSRQEGDLVFYDQTAELAGDPNPFRMMINPTGKVGINNANPAEQLDVVGNIKSSENMLASSFVKAGGSATEYLMADGSVSTGATGPQGPQGEPGPIGEKGDKGNDGNIGDMGMPGPEGPIGEKGDKGDKGDTGDMGMPGPAPDLSGYATTTDVFNLQTTVINNQIQSDNLLAETQYLNLSLYTEVNRATAAEEYLASKIYFRDAYDFPGSIYSSNPGNVGIGTDLPSEKLDVNGNLKVRQNATVNGNLNVNGINFGVNGNNLAIGSSTLFSNTTGNYNTATGLSALGGNTEGSINTAYAVNALANNTTGSNNTANGANALVSNTIGNNNTANGKDALFTNSTGSNNTALGFNANVASDNLDNATAIGASATVDASNKIQLGNTDVTSVNTSGTFTGAGFKTPTGTSSQYLMADGSISVGPVATTMGAIGSSANANGATIAAGVLNLQPATASFGGVVTTGAQSFSGVKTFSGDVVTNGNVIISNPTNAAINATALATAANILDGYITSTTAAAVSIGLPTATAIASAIGGTVANGTSLEFSVFNSGATNAVTLGLNVGITVQTNPVITGSNSLVISAAAKMGHFRLVFTSATTAMLFRIY